MGKVWRNNTDTRKQEAPPDRCATAHLKTTEHLGTDSSQGTVHYLGTDSSQGRRVGDGVHVGLVIVELRQLIDCKALF